MSHKCEHGKDSDVCVLCHEESQPTRPDFVCPKCGGGHFGRDTAKDTSGRVVVLDTVRCQTGACDWRGKYLAKLGRPPRDSECAIGHIHLRVTLERKGWYVRMARLHNLTLAEWMQRVCDEESGYPPKSQLVTANGK
jgi:predicted RNA-binding Zn-ribbon protein involved in translation (DUF1610 family)